MGYTTDFTGYFELDKKLTDEHAAYLSKFAETRRMTRDEDKVKDLADPLRVQAGLPVGPEGAYFVGGKGFSGQDQDDSITNYNKSPGDQPGLWCQWAPNEDGTGIEWDGGEKFYNFTEWLEYIVANFLDPWGYKLNGEVEWFGEDPDDRGLIRVTDNEVACGFAKVSYDF